MNEKTQHTFYVEQIADFRKVCNIVQRISNGAVGEGHFLTFYIFHLKICKNRTREKTQTYFLIEQIILFSMVYTNLQKAFCES